MKRYLLDTGIAADYLNRRGSVYARARQHIAEGARLGLCAPVLERNIWVWKPKDEGP